MGLQKMFRTDILTFDGAAQDHLKPRLQIHPSIFFTTHMDAD